MAGELLKTATEVGGLCEERFIRTGKGAVNERERMGAWKWVPEIAVKWAQ